MSVSVHMYRHHASYHKKPYLISLLYSSIFKCSAAFDVPPSHQFFPQLTSILFLLYRCTECRPFYSPISYTLLESAIHCVPGKFCAFSNTYLFWYGIMGPLLLLGISYPALAKFPSMQNAHIFLSLTLFLLWCRFECLFSWRDWKGCNTQGWKQARWGGELID